MNKRFYVFGTALVVLVLLLIYTANVGSTTGLFVHNGLPTPIPPDVLTSIVQTLAAPTETPYPNIFTQIPQTEQAAQQTLAVQPTRDRQLLYPIVSVDSNGTPIAPPAFGEQLEGTLAGNGILYANRNANDDADYKVNKLSWKEWTYNSQIDVSAGQSRKTPSQGVIMVHIFPHHLRYYNRIVIKSPVQAGDLNIVGAVGERLILNSQQGQTFYFDLPSMSFVDGLDASVPTATPVPTPTLAISPADDASDIPFYVYDIQPVNTNLNFFINSPDDYDWFEFFSQTSGDITVLLDPQGGNYGLRVVQLSEGGKGTIIGEDTMPGTGKKQVVVSNASAGYYMARVWSLDGSFSESQSYILRFDVSQSQAITPILECVAANADGTYTAHFGYDNPNSYDVIVEAGEENIFHPDPIYRTGQPEYFQSGLVTNWFAILFDGNDLTWHLNGTDVTANKNSQACP